MLIKLLDAKVFLEVIFDMIQILVKLFMLEINTQPGMTKTSLAPEQAAFCNINMVKMVRILIEEATYEC